MRIIDKTYRWNGRLSKRNVTKRIVLHHAEASRCTADQIHSWHLDRGWSGIGYHFFVTKDGIVYRGRPEDTIGAHASGANADSLGICAEGKYTTETMPEAQKQAIAELVIYLKDKYNVSLVQKHKEVTDTDCPGKNYPFDEIMERVNKPVKQSKQILTVDGLWGKDTTRRAQEVFGTPVDGIVSNQYLKYKDDNLGLLDATFEWEKTPGQNGSSLIKAIQRKVGVTDDGFIGPKTIKAMQKWLGTVQDGCVSKPSGMVKALQKWLNEQ